MNISQCERVLQFLRSYQGFLCGLVDLIFVGKVVWWSPHSLWMALKPFLSLINFMNEILGNLLCLCHDSCPLTCVVKIRFQILVLYIKQSAHSLIFLNK